MLSLKIPGSTRVVHIVAEAVATIEELKKVGDSLETLYDICLKNGTVIQGIGADIVEEVKAILHPAAASPSIATIHTPSP